MKKLLPFVLALAATSALADVTVPLQQVDEKGVGAAVGQVVISETRYGLVFTPNLHGLTDRKSVV